MENTFPTEYMFYNSEFSPFLPSKSFPLELRKVLVDLEFISMIKRGYKVNINLMNFVDSASWIGSIKRTFYHENRKTTLEYIIKTVSQAIDFINKYSKSPYLKILVNSLNTARIGISELAGTYRDDPDFISNIKVCLTNIDIHLDKHKHLLFTSCNSLLNDSNEPIKKTLPIDIAKKDKKDKKDSNTGSSSLETRLSSCGSCGSQNSSESFKQENSGS